MTKPVQPELRFTIEFENELRQGFALLFIILVGPDFLSVLFFLGLCKFQSFHLLQVLFLGLRRGVGPGSNPSTM